MSTFTNNDRHFPLLELPRELRDVIYDSLTIEPHHVVQYFVNEDGEKLEDVVASKITVKNVPYWPLLCTSHQVEHEYSKQVVHNPATLILSDHGDFEFSPLNLSLSMYKSFQKLEYLGVIQCSRCEYNKEQCKAALDAQSAMDWLKETITPLEKLEEVEAVMFLQWPDGSGQKWPESPHAEGLTKALKELVGMDNVRKLAVYKSGRADFNVGEERDEGKLWVRWSKMEGWVTPEVLVEELKSSG